MGDIIHCGSQTDRVLSSTIEERGKRYQKERDREIGTKRERERERERERDRER